MSGDEVNQDRQEFLRKVRRFEKASSQIASLRHEIGELSKKKPDGPINKFKLGIINKVLEDLNAFLEEMKPFEDFELFDPDQLPTNSDVKLILSQYINSCGSKERRDTVRDSDLEKTFWCLDGKPMVEKSSNSEIFYEDYYSDEEDDEEDEEVTEI